MQVFSNHSLLQWNTFHLDAKAKVFAEYDDIDELRSLLRQYSNLPMLHIGRGSNLLFTADFPGIVLHSRICFIKTLSCTDKQVILQVGSGVVFDDMIAHGVAKGACHGNHHPPRANLQPRGMPIRLSRQYLQKRTERTIYHHLV